MYLHLKAFSAKSLSSIAISTVAMVVILDSAMKLSLCMVYAIPEKSTFSLVMGGNSIQT